MISARTNMLAAGVALAALLAGGASAQVAGGGRMLAGAGYSSLYGATGNLGLEIEDMFEAGIDLDLKYRAGSYGRGLSLDLTKRTQLGDTFFGSRSEMDVGLSLADDDWDFRSYRRQSWGLSLGVTSWLTENLNYRVGLFYQSDDLRDPDPTLSPYILADMGDTEAAGIDLSLSFSNRGEGIMAPGAEFGLGLRSSGLGNAREFTAATVSADLYQPAFAGTVLNLGVSGGVVHGGAANGYVAINDRAFLGGDLPRGFEYGGMGPIDPATGDSLGGTRYVATTVELMVPTRRPQLWGGVFWDAATLSDLPGISDPAIDESSFLRQSVGLSMNYTTGMGEFSASLAQPIRERAQDDTQSLSFSFTAKF